MQCFGSKPLFATFSVENIFKIITSTPNGLYLKKWLGVKVESKAVQLHGNFPWTAKTKNREKIFNEIFAII
jgi:hypothetical protein